MSLIFRFFFFFIYLSFSSTSWLIARGRRRGAGINSSKKNDQISATKGPLAQPVDKRWKPAADDGDTRHPSPPPPFRRRRSRRHVLNFATSDKTFNSKPILAVLYYTPFPRSNVFILFIFPLQNLRTTTRSLVPCSTELSELIILCLGKSVRTIL